MSDPYEHAPGRTTGQGGGGNQSHAAGRRRSPSDNLDPDKQPGYQEQADALVPGALDLKNFGTWAQSALNAVDRGTPFLGRPLVVDGIVGSNTRRGVKGFQGVAPGIVSGAAAIARTGRLDAGTTWALEQATASKNPEGRASTQPVAVAPEVQQEGSGATTPELPEEQVSSGVQGAVNAAVARGGMTPADAYAALKRETEAKRTDLGDKDTVRALANIQAKYDKLDAAARPALETYTKTNFFKEYWMLHCDQYANALMAKINGGRLPSLNALRARTNKAIDAKGGDPGGEGQTQVAGRDLRFRGETMATLGALLAAENAEAGIGVHVKLRPDSDRPYDPGQADELHHWFVYIGDGKFADSFSSGQTGPKAHDFMVAWMNRDFHNRGRPGERFDYSKFHTEAYCEAASIAEFRALMGGVEASKEELDAMVVEADDREAKADKKRALRAARAKEAKLAASKMAKKKELPKPKSGFCPKVSAIYRPQKTRP